jgi:uncharacterized GH25 family protein
MRLKASRYLLPIGVAIGALGATPAEAHFPWLMPSNYHPAEGKSADVYLSYGHHFPFEGFLAGDRIDSVEIVDPAGKHAPLKSDGSGAYATPRLAEGAYVVLASQKGGFFTRTRNGNKRQSKEGLSDVIGCSYSSNTMKAVLNVGSGNGALETKFGQPLEIVPLSNPAALKVGDFMDVQVLMKGEPYDGMVFATYAGFSAEGAYAYAVEADNQGKASIRILNPGQWLVYANAKRPYKDAKVCDLESYTATLTFGIR